MTEFVWHLLHSSPATPTSSLTLFMCLLRVARTTVKIQKYAKSCHETTWAIILKTQSTYWKLQVCLRLHCSKEAGLQYEAVLSQREAGRGLHNSVKLGVCSLELNLSCFATSWGSGLDRNRTFFVKYVLKSQALYTTSQ